jgi:hypothetical protein
VYHKDESFLKDLSGENKTLVTSLVARASALHQENAPKDATGEEPVET